LNAALEFKTWNTKTPEKHTVKQIARRDTEPPVGALVPGQQVARFGEGITTEEMNELVWVRPEIVVELKFAEWTEAGLLRHPEVASLNYR
jgi:ATP-dependent DNA ligase